MTATSLLAGLSTEAKQDEALDALAAILGKLIAAPATQATLAAVLDKLPDDPATQSTLAALLAKLSPLTKASPGYVVPVEFDSTGSAFKPTQGSVATIYTRSGGPGTSVTGETRTVTIGAESWLKTFVYSRDTAGAVSSSTETAWVKQ